MNLTGDPVHPGAPGHRMMAAALLKGHGADAFVSEATVDAAGSVASAKGCTITNVKVERGASKTAAGKDSPPKKDAPPAAKAGPAAAKAALPDLAKQTEAAGAKIREAARPQTLHFVLTPAK